MAECDIEFIPKLGWIILGGKGWCLDGKVYATEAEVLKALRLIELRAANVELKI